MISYQHIWSEPVEFRLALLAIKLYQEYNMPNIATTFYATAKEYANAYRLTDEFVGFALGYCLFQPVVASADFPTLLDTARQEYTTIKESINSGNHSG